MQDTRELITENHALGWTALIYYAVVLIAFAIGLYGLFSLIWMAGDSLTHNVQALGLLL